MKPLSHRLHNTIVIGQMGDNIELCNNLHKLCNSTQDVVGLQRIGLRDIMKQGKAHKNKRSTWDFIKSTFSIHNYMSDNASYVNLQGLYVFL